MNHVPVLLEEATEYLNLHPGSKVVDATYGYGGHSREILKKIKPKGKMLAIDRDWESYNDCKTFSQYENSILCTHGNFAELLRLAREHSFDKIDGILFDLGFSTPQVRSALRGFSFTQEGPLDMRMDQTQKLDAKQLVNNWVEKDLVRILREYGEERYANKIARKIVENRKIKEVKTTFDLVKLIKEAVPASYRHQKIHFATKTFQAIRIAVNDELENLKKGLAASLDILKTGGRVVVISFNSL